MTFESGASYHISEKIKRNFNFANTLTIIRNNGVTAQFILDNDKGSGAMPIQHLNYLIRREELTPVKNMIEDEENIG